ncbi:intermembrane phospholipid transport system, substrate binding protein MlaD [Gammaproteobacteria bacterium]
MKQQRLEISVGAFMALGLAALFMLAMQVSNLSIFGEDPGYGLTARFQNIGGLKVRSPISVAGVRIGRVTGISFDAKTYEAVVQMRIRNAYSTFPKDTSASILTSGLLGEQYVGLEPGGDSQFLKEGDELKLTQSALVLERFIGQFLYNKAQQESTDKAKPPHG